MRLGRKVRISALCRSRKPSRKRHKPGTTASEERLVFREPFLAREAEGLYRGIHRNGRLVAAAGTHVIGRRERIAVVGNVLTSSAFRGAGYARATTSAVTAGLLEFCDDVVLNVRSDNSAAIHAYASLGYSVKAEFEERLVIRRSSLSVPRFLRRFFGGA